MSLAPRHENDLLGSALTMPGDVSRVDLVHDSSLCRRRVVEFTVEVGGPGSRFPRS
jgi:hypothetical protein